MCRKRTLTIYDSEKRRIGPYNMSEFDPDQEELMDNESAWPSKYKNGVGLVD